MKYVLGLLTILWLLEVVIVLISYHRTERS
jgi:hypothetical protein